MVFRSTEEWDGSLAGVRVGVEAIMELQVYRDDIVPEFESKDCNRSGGSSLLLRSRRLIQVVHHQNWAIPESVGGCFRDEEVIREGSSEQDAVLWEK